MGKFDSSGNRIRKLAHERERQNAGCPLIDYQLLLNFISRERQNPFASDFVASFLQEFGDQEENTLILSPLLKEITTPDGAAALRFLGTQTIMHMPCLSI
jgi:hypothetical protein